MLRTSGNRRNGARPIATPVKRGAGASGNASARIAEWRPSALTSRSKRARDPSDNSTCTPSPVCDIDLTVVAKRIERPARATSRSRISCSALRSIATMPGQSGPLSGGSVTMSIVSPRASKTGICENPKAASTQASRSPIAPSARKVGPVRLSPTPATSGSCDSSTMVARMSWRASAIASVSPAIPAPTIRTEGAAWSGMMSLVPVVLDFEQREGAQHVRRVGRGRRMQVGTVEIGEARDAEQAETALHFVLEQLEHAHDAGLAGGRERIALHAAEPDQVGAGGDPLDHVAAAAEAAVDDDPGAPGRRLDHFRQHVEG